MPYPHITATPRHGLLLLAGLWLIAPAALSSTPAGAQGQPENAVHQETASDRADGLSDSYLHQAKVIVLKNELRGAPDVDDMSRQQVAPRLQSRIKKNTEFAAFVKLVRATSKRKYTLEELRKLYLSFKAWSYRHNKTDE